MHVNNCVALYKNIIYHFMYVQYLIHRMARANLNVKQHFFKFHQETLVRFDGIVDQLQSASLLFMSLNNSVFISILYRWQNDEIRHVYWNINYFINKWFSFTCLWGWTSNIAEFGLILSNLEKDSESKYQNLQRRNSHRR